MNATPAIEYSPDDLYRVFLERGGDPAGLEHYRRALAFGSAGDAIASMVGSDEFQGRCERLGKDRYHVIVDDLYRLLLDRQADPEGAAHYVEKLTAGATIGEIFDEIAGSNECRNIAGARWTSLWGEAAHSLYRLFLGRDPTEIEQHAAVDRLASGEAAEVVRAIIGGDEHRQRRAERGIGDDALGYIRI